MSKKKKSISPKPGVAQSNTAGQYERKQLDATTLLLDPQNPRLAPGDRGKSQERLLEIMLDRFEVSEIAESICSAGFLPMDPFVGYTDKTKTYILEGNRRLATIKLLLDPSLAPERHKKTWSDFAARLSESSRREMQKLSVLVYADRRDAGVLSYIGYRHVNGVMSWEAEEKAAFIASLLEDEEIGWTYDDVARKLGSRPAYVEKLYVAHRLIVQAKEEDVPGNEIMRKQFGVLTRALQSPGDPSHDPLTQTPSGYNSPQEGVSRWVSRSIPTSSSRPRSSRWSCSATP